MSIKNMLTVVLFKRDDVGRTIVYDHRVIDGAVGGRFMSFLRGKLAEPKNLHP